MKTKTNATKIIIIIIIISLLGISSSTARIDLTGRDSGSGGGASGNPFNQNLNTTDSATFNTITANGSGLTVDWNSIYYMPAGFADGIDNVGGGGGNPFNQNLNTTDNPTFSNLYLDGKIVMQNYGNINNVGELNAFTVNTGHGSNELYGMNQNVKTTSGVTFNTVTGNGSGLTIDWSKLYYVPAGFADGIDNVGGCGNHFNQDLNTTDSPTFVNITLSGANWDTNVSDDFDNATINNIGDVDTLTDTPSKHDVLMWDGSQWICVPEGTVFTFSIASFSDGESTTQAIGSGTWQSASTMSYTASYNNGPPIHANVTMSNNGGAYNKVGYMNGANNLTGTNTVGAISYPANKDQYLRFRLEATDGEDADTDTESAIYFRNYIRWGDSTTSTGHSEAQIEALPGSAISNDITRTESINAGVGEYLVFAYPTTYTQMDDGSDYETDGVTDFRFNGIACAMTHDTSTLSITTNGHTENYDTYVSDLANLGNHNLITYTSGGTINPLYYGITTKTSGFTEADIEGLGTNEITNDNTQVWNSVTTGSGEYMLFSFPKRLGIIAFWVGGFEGGFESPETVSVTNSNGWTEDYYVWRSTNSNLGATVVETK